MSMPLSKNCEDFALQLAMARRTGVTFDQIGHPGRPETLSEAYSIQARIFEHLGMQVIGGKVSYASRAAQVSAGVSGPAFAPILKGNVVRADRTISVALPHGRAVVLETEIGLSDTGRPFLLFEVATSSFRNPLKNTASDVIADLCGVYRIIALHDISLIERDRIRLEQDGSSAVEVEVGHSSEALAAASKLDAFLVRQYSVASRGLVYATGTMHAPITVDRCAEFKVSINARPCFRLQLVT